MGLEFLHVIMSVEDEFGVEIPEEDAQQFNTVGDLYDYLVTRVGDRRSERCLSSAAFYRLRRALCVATGAERSAIRPDAVMDHVVPRKRRRAVWRAVRREIGLRLPPLSPPWVVDFAQLCVVVGLGTLLVRCLIGWTPWPRLAELLAFGVALDLVARSLFTRFPRRGYKVKDVVGYVLTHDGPRLATEACAWKPEDVWTKLQRVVGWTLRVPAEKVTPEANWFSDLDCG